MRRSPGVSLALFTILVAIPSIGSAVPASAASARRPDIIVIVTDDQRAGTLSWMPTVRRTIVERGRMFGRAMVPTSLCCPSRASLFTGEFAHTTKVWSNASGWRRFTAAGMEEKTVAVWLRRSGYRTALIGKYLNWFSGTRPPIGWSVWHSFVGVNGKYFNFDLLHTGGRSTHYGSSAADYSTDVLRRHAVRFLRSTPTTEPLFLYFAPYAPHSPFTPAPRHVSVPAPIGTFSPPNFNEADVSDKPPWIRGLPLVDRSMIEDVRVQQYRSLRSVDEAVGALVQVQRDRHRLARTLLVFISDNGVMWGEHRATGKFLPYRGATRIPLAVAWPRHVPAGTRDRRLALNVDIAVTIAAAAEAPHAPVAGRNLLRRWTRRGFVLEAGRAEVPGGGGSRVERPAYCGWRTARFLFVQYATGRQELYDYRADPWELRDVHRLAAYRDRTRDLRRHAHAACDPTPPDFRWR